jgi:diguanylate cyclase (GGDEF)-like protein
MLVRKDGTTFLASEAIRELAGGADGEPRGFVNVLHDISARAAADRDLYRRAHFDELTQLPNRRMFYERLQRAIALMKVRSSQPMAVLFADVDHFKSVNDEFGHIAADRILAAIARRLERCFRPEDIVARIGGDEFGILIDRLHHTADASEAAERIRLEMRKPVNVDGMDILLTVSVGIAIGSPRHDRPEDILRDADTAMYAAKTAGRARAALFETLPAQLSPKRADPRCSRRISR